MNRCVQRWQSLLFCAMLRFGMKIALPMDMKTQRKSEAARRRIWAAHREALIAALGWTPELEVCDPGERYVANCGEMLVWLREVDPMRAGVLEAAVLAELAPLRDDSWIPRAVAS